MEAVPPSEPASPAKGPPMTFDNPQDDRAYMETHNVHAILAAALAQVVREKPAQPLTRLAELVKDAYGAVPAEYAQKIFPVGARFRPETAAQPEPAEAAAEDAAAPMAVEPPAAAEPEA